MWRRRWFVLGVLAGVLVLAAVPARAQEAPYVDWAPLLPPVPAPYTPSTEPDCADGSDACIDRTIAEMYRRLNTVVPVCDHNAVFSVAYLRVTEAIRDAVRAGFFDDARWLNHEDAVFARMYFNSYDDWAAGRRDRVPAAWLQAFDAARDKEVPALGNFLMAMNAHINRDMPFLLAGIGITAPDGTSRKPDHDRWNKPLAGLYVPVLKEVADRFDPTADDFDAGPIDDEVAYFVLMSWREGVWRNAERLALARSDAERARVAESIERFADTIATTLRLLYQSDPEATAARDAWCASHGGQDPTAGAAAGSSGPRAGAAFLRARGGRLRVRGNRVLVPLGCPPDTTGCRGRVTLLRGRRALASRRFDLRAGVRRTFTMRLRAADARRLRRRARPVITVRVGRTSAELRLAR